MSELLKNEEYKNKKYHYKIQNKLKQMVENGESSPEEYKQFLLPYNSTLSGGSAVEDAFKYKAKKYHYKNQVLCKQIIANGKQLPEGYEKYLLPFSE
jgi:hypothetical protein